MDRRDFNRREFSQASALILGTAALGLPGLAAAQARAPQDGKDYRTLDKRVAVDAPAGKVEVIEFFWYSCPHCNAFEPQLEAWVKKLPADVAFKRVPVSFRADFEPQQRLYYALEAMNRLDLHNKVFQAIHGDKQPTNTPALIQAWAQKAGLDMAKFNDAFNSFGVASKAKRATQLQDAYGVEGVPAMGVAGRYYTDGTLSGNMDRALQVVTFLVDQARRTR